jgi:hypothetical protein
VKKNLVISITALTLLVALAVPTQLAAQDKQDQHPKHHHYQLVDLGSTSAVLTVISTPEAATTLIHLSQS